MKPKLKLLPDSGLPLEEEAKRNIENLVDNIGESAASVLCTDYSRELFINDTREILLERYGQLFEDQIKEGRKG